MDFETYVRDAVITDSTIDKSFPDRVEHAMLGILTESGEIVDLVKKSKVYFKDLAVDKLLEELGDLCWYHALLTDTLVKAGIEINPETQGLFDDISEDMLAAMGVVDRIYYLAAQTANAAAAAACLRYEGRADYSADGPDASSIASLCAGVGKTIEAIGEIAGLDVGVVRHRNIQKLIRRYPERSWSQRRAVERDLDAEKQALDGK